MIISASRRTDIPAYFSEWFMNRIEEGFVMVKNPFNAKQITKVSLLPEDIDGIVFWTKNPKPIIDKLDILDKKGIEYYFQFTLNPYDKSIEKNVPLKKDLIEQFKILSSLIGKERVIWRYDPIIFNELLTTAYHKKYFEIFAKRLSGYTEKCMTSFLTHYKSTTKNMSGNLHVPKDEEIYKTMEEFSKIASSNNIKLFTCCSEYDLKKYGVESGKCIDGSLFSKIANSSAALKKDRGQRDGCLCHMSKDIGSYNSCLHQCLYCYANHNFENIEKIYSKHNPKSPLLIGDIESQI